MDEDLDGTEEVVYELGSWPRRAAHALGQHLIDRDIAHGWVEGELHVGEDDEEAVDGLVAVVEVAHGIDPDVEPAPPDGDVDYDLSHWTEPVLVEAERRLEEAGIEHGWEAGAVLIAFDGDVDEINALLEDLENPEALPPEEDDGGLDGQILGDLFLAADRLQRDPSDGSAVQRLVVTLQRAEGGGVPYGVDPSTWMRARALGETIRSRLASGDLAISVQDLARELRTLLHPLV